MVSFKRAIGYEMKKGLLHPLLFSYSALLLKPMLPFFTNSVAHIFWYSRHTGTIHYVKGS